jgi:4-carboxymuconolactone decarboxylase
LRRVSKSFAAATVLILTGGLTPLANAQTQTPPASSTEQQSRAQQLMGDVTPKLAEEVLYGDIWERPELSKRDRSLATVSALIALNRPDQLRSHLRLALRNGVTREELSETITHIAFYAGWPSSVTAALIAKEVFKED